MKHFLFLILAIMPLGLAAQGDEVPRFRNLVITLTDGRTEEVPLLTEPRITYQDSLFVVTTALETKTWPRARVKGYTFSTDEATGIKSMSKRNARQVEWELKDRKLLLNHLPEGSSISLYRTDGQRVMSTRRSGHCTIDLSRLLSGVYLFEANDQVHKIVLL